MPDTSVAHAIANVSKEIILQLAQRADNALKIENFRSRKKP
jgi:hypothetical protein